MKYRESCEAGKAFLEEAGIAEAALDARLLLEYACGTGYETLLLHGDREVAVTEQALYRQMLARRADRMPLQYITGEQAFMGLEFRVNEAVLIPRQDTEILVERVCKEVRPGMRILDMCTGSGCILISILHMIQGCSGVGADISGEALKVARLNAERLLSGADICFIESDMFAEAEGRFDVIVSNPPYIKNAVISALMPEVKDYEPAEALDGGPDGLHYYRKLAREAGNYLNPMGMLFLEIGYDQADEVSALLAGNRFTGIEVIRDYAGLPRVVCGRRQEI